MTDTTKKYLAIGLLVAVAALAGVAAWLLLSDDGDEAAPPTSAPAEGTWPLTGLPAAAGDPVDRPALVVKISASEQARPQDGINQADVVIEELVEGISRLLAAFHSTKAAPVGPVRSARDSDLELLPAFGRPIFVWGGANEGVAARLAEAPLVSRNVDPDDAEGSFRADDRPAPDNLMIDSTDTFWADPGDALAAVAPVEFGFGGGDGTAGTTTTSATAPPPGPDGTGVSVAFGSTTVEYVWSADRGGWVRFQDGTPHVDTAGDVVAPANVIVMATPYDPAPSDPRSPLAVTTGQGDATVLVDGRVVDATWSRENSVAPYRLVDDATGAAVGFTPGRTWIALPQDVAGTRLDEARGVDLLGQL